MASEGGGGERFRFIRELGHGGMGSVDLVWDALRQEAVARKRFRIRPGSSGGRERAIAHMKREFRAVAELSHPALVPLYELFEDADGLFFTMMALDGVDLFHYCHHATDNSAAESSRSQTATRTTMASWPGELGASSCPDGPDGDPTAWLVAPACDYGRLVAVLPALLSGIAHLHAHGLVHRDLKPSNILVEANGAARILDFGLLAELSAATGQRAGTPAYMSPEQIAGAPPSPAMDMYALGATLFEVVAGRTPFLGTREDLLQKNSLAPPPRLEAIVEDAPAPLVAAVDALLRKDPAQRPSLEQLAERLLPAFGIPVPRLPRVASADTPLFGRDALQRRIAAVFDAAPFAGLVLEGPAGIGKSALAHWAGRHARERGWAVLRGRARATELVPFNAVDGIVEELDPALRALDGTVGGADVVAARRRASVAFPALAPDQEGAASGGGHRRQAFDAFARLLELLASHHQGVLLIVDDLQWADADSLSCLGRLVALAPDRVKLLATHRTDLPAPASREWLGALPVLERSAVPALEVEALSEIVARHAGPGLDPGAARRIVEECDGRAYLAEVAGHLMRESSAPAERLTHTIAARLRRLPQTSKAIVATLAAAECWLSVGEVADALNVTVGSIDSLARELAALAIIRRAGAVGRADALDFYHDVARMAAVEAVGAEHVREGHAVLAALLDAREQADPLRLVRHLAGAGRVAEAAERGIVEARNAESRRAHGLAAQLYELAAIGLPEQAMALRRARAMALIRGGYYAQAVEQIDRLSGGDDRARADLAFDRGFALAMGGGISAALGSLDACLALEGVRPLAAPGLGALRDMLRVRAGPRRVAPGKPSPTPRTRSGEQSEREAELTLLLIWEEPLAGLSWALRSRELADRDGQPERGAFAEYVLAFATVATGSRAGDSELSARYLESARRRAGTTPRDAHLSVLESMVHSLMEFRRGRFRAAAAGCEAVARDLESCGRAQTYTHLLALYNACGAHLCGERPDLLAAALAAFETACPAQQGAMETNVAMLKAALGLFEGDQDAYRGFRAAARAGSEAEVRLHHIVAELLLSRGELYWGDPLLARRNVAAAARLGRRFQLASTYFGGAIATACALLEAAALRAGDRKARRHRIAKWARIARRAPPVLSSGAVRAEAYVADDPGRAVALLREAEAMAERFDTPVSLGIARYQLGIRVGGDEGRDLIAAGRRDLAAVGASEHLLEEDPSRLTDRTRSRG